jgi:hypothetical protein
MCRLKSDGYCWRLSWRWWSAASWALALTCLICLAWALPFPACAESLEGSEPDWPELSSSLDEIEAGLQMTEAPLSSIDSSIAERERNLSAREAASAQKELELKETEQRLQLRDSALTEREQAFSVRESLYAAMKVDLAKANKKLKNGWIWGLLAFGAGMGVDRLLQIAMK